MIIIISIFDSTEETNKYIIDAVKFFFPLLPLPRFLFLISIVHCEYLHCNIWPKCLCACVYDYICFRVSFFYRNQSLLIQWISIVTLLMYRVHCVPLPRMFFFFFLFFPFAVSVIVTRSALKNKRKKADQLRNYFFFFLYQVKNMMNEVEITIKKSVGFCYQCARSIDVYVLQCGFFFFFFG